MVDQLKISTLGGLSISRNDVPVTGFISRKVEALLVYLVCERREHPREMLAELLWDDLTQARTMGNLRTALSSLQAKLAPFLCVTRSSVMFNFESDYWLDISDLQKALDLAETEWSSGLSRSVAKTLESALSLYHGDFLAGFHLRDSRGFEGWKLLEQERLRGKVIEAMLRLTRDSLERRAYPAGIEQARRLLQLDPLWEEAHRLLMTLLAASGQRSAALAQYDACAALLRDELDVPPDAETTRLYAEIQAEQIKVSTPTHGTSKLPTPATPFIPRPAELQQIAERLDDPNCRLLTLVGSGGIGKTRLALHAAHERLDDYRDGVYFISLASVTSPDFIVTEIANTLKFNFEKGSALKEQLLDHLQNQETLLVMDNFEHLVQSADLLSDILTRAPRVKILVTSREWLNLQGEWILQIEGMQVPRPEDAANADSFNAVQLFVQCARRVRPSFTLEPDKESVIRICQLAEGMPLSIELAATWLRVLNCAEIATQVESGIDFLATKVRNIPERHRSVRAVFDHSWNLLEAHEQAVTRKIGVFRGVFNLEAAAQVAGASLETLTALLEKSLLRLQPGGYYDMHELLRQYAYDQLTSAGETAATRDAHLEYFVALAEKADSEMRSAEQVAWLTRLEREHDNLRTALRWAIEREHVEPGLRLAAALWEFWYLHSHITEGRQWLQPLLNMSSGSETSTRASALHGAGYLAFIQGEYDRAEQFHTESLSIRQSLGDKQGISGSLNNLGLMAWSRGDFVSAHKYYEQSLALRREINYRIGVASVLSNLGLLYKDMGDFNKTAPYFEEAITIFRELNDIQGIALTLYYMGALALDKGDFTNGEAYYTECLDLLRTLGNVYYIAGAKYNLALFAQMQGNDERTARLLQDSLAMRREIGDRQGIAEILTTQASLAIREGNLDRAQILVNQSLLITSAIRASRNHALNLNAQGIINLQRGELEAAWRYLKRAMTILKGSGDRRSIIECLNKIAQLAVAQAQFERAIKLFATAEASRASIGIRFLPSDHATWEQALETARQSVGAEAFERAWSEGQQMKATEATALGLAEPATAP